jgi:putative toxin-antitoxin system antitoxin component (TIGR02293 family)
MTKSRLPGRKSTPAAGSPEAPSRSSDTGRFVVVKSGRAKSMRVSEGHEAYPATRPAEARAVREAAVAAAVALVAATPSGSAIDRMGRLLDLPLHSETDLVRAVTDGLPASTLRRLTEALDVDPALVGPESTIRRRLQDNARFTTDESERMVRIARVYTLAMDLFGEDRAARAWLEARQDYLPDAPPISPFELAVTDAGARLVEQLLLRTAHGIF